jgi:hypothetical protein
MTIGPEHDVSGQIIDQTGYGGRFKIERTDPKAQARHAHCPMIALDPVEDPAARSALRHYAAVAAMTRPQFSRDLVDLIDQLDHAKPLSEPPSASWDEAARRLGLDS